MVVKNESLELVGEGSAESSSSSSASSSNWDEESLDLSYTSNDTTATTDTLGAALATGPGPADSTGPFPHLFPHGQPDEFFFCVRCAEWGRDVCSEHPPDFMQDEEDSELCTPLSLRLSTDGVETLEDIPAGTLMGPYQGPSRLAAPAVSIQTLPYVWEVRGYDGRSTYFLPQSRDEQSHWTQRVPLVQTRKEQNLTAIQFKGDVYYRAQREVSAGEALGVFAGSGLPVTRWETSAETAPAVGGAIECGLCPAAHLNSYEERAAHLRSARHRPVDDVRCSQCDYVARNRHGLRAHAYSAHAAAPFYCSFCQRPFSSGSKMDDHVAKHHSSAQSLQRSFACPRCPKAFFKRHHLSRHLALHDNPRHACPKCPATLRSAETLRLHLESVHSNGETKYACSDCPKTFASAIYLQRHRHRVHNPAKKRPSEAKAKVRPPKAPPLLNCRFCEARLSTAGARLRHEQRKHPSELATLESAATATAAPQPFPCQRCPAGFQSLAALKYHLRRHDGDFAATCPHCDKGFILASEMRKHVKRQHPEKGTEGGGGGEDWTAIQADMIAELSDDDQDESL